MHLCRSRLGRGPSRRCVMDRSGDGARQSDGPRQRRRGGRSPWAGRRSRRRPRRSPVSASRSTGASSSVPSWRLATEVYRHQPAGRVSLSGSLRHLGGKVRPGRRQGAGRHRAHRPAQPPPVAGDCELAEGIKLLARAHQSTIWSHQRQLNALRSTLARVLPRRPGGLWHRLASTEAMAVLAIAPTPELGAGLSRSKIASALRRGGRQRNIERRAEEIQGALRAEQLGGAGAVAEAYGSSPVGRLALIILELNAPDRGARDEHCRSILTKHPDAKIVRSLPGLGTVLGARVLGEFGDDPELASPMPSLARTTPARHLSPKRRDTAGSCSPASPATDGSAMPATSGPSAHSRPHPGARNYYDQLRARGKTHRQALRQLANRLVGILHVCLERGVLYDESSPGRGISASRLTSYGRGMSRRSGRGPPTGTVELPDHPCFPLPWDASALTASLFLQEATRTRSRNKRYCSWARHGASGRRSTVRGLERSLGA